MQNQNVTHEGCPSYFISYTDQYNVITRMTDAQIGALYRAVYTYVVTGEYSEPEDPIAAVVFRVMQSQVARDIARYIQRVEAGRRGGNKRVENRSKKSAKRKRSTDKKCANPAEKPQASPSEAQAKSSKTKSPKNGSVPGLSQESGAKENAEFPHAFQAKSSEVKQEKEEKEEKEEYTFSSVPKTEEKAYDEEEKYEEEKQNEHEEAYEEEHEEALSEEHPAAPAPYPPAHSCGDCEREAPVAIQRDTTIEEAVPKAAQTDDPTPDDIPADDLPLPYRATGALIADIGRIFEEEEQLFAEMPQSDDEERIASLLSEEAPPRREASDNTPVCAGAVPADTPQNTDRQLKEPMDKEADFYINLAKSMLFPPQTNTGGSSPPAV